MITYWVGVDPGKGGGIACLRFSDTVACGVRTWNMPKTDADMRAVMSELNGATFAVLEEVASSPQMGVRSAFTFGMMFGQIRYAMGCLGVPLELVKPQRWQAVLGCMSGGDKNKTKARAQQLFPSTKVTHAVADAILLAEYGRRMAMKD